jgi:hypothetical protein
MNLPYLAQPCSSYSGYQGLTLVCQILCFWNMAAPFVKKPERVLLKKAGSQTSQHVSPSERQRYSPGPDAALRSDVEFLAATAASGRDLCPVQSQGSLRSRCRRGSSTQATLQGKPGSSIKYLAQRQDQTGREHSLFFSWSCNGETRIVDIPIADPEDEVQIYRDIKEQFYRSIGRWRHVSIFDVQSIRPTKVGELISRLSMKWLLELTREDSTWWTPGRLFCWA